MFSSYGERRGRRRQLQTLRNACMLIAFTVMLFSPIAANASVADQIDAQRDQMDQATETPPEVTEEPPVEATEEPFVEETEEPVVEATEEPVNELLGSIEIDYWECPAAYDIANPDLDNLFQDCTGVDGVLFEVGASDGVTSSQLTGEFGDSHVSFTELPTGMTTISKLDGPPLSSVFCNGIVQHGGPETGIMPLQVNNGSVQWDLQDDEIAFCSWLTTAEQPAADLTVYKFTCPEGYDVHEQGADPMVDCTEATNGVTFLLTDDDPNTTDPQSDTGDSVEGAVYFGSLPAGEYNLEETLPDGIESAFLWECESTPSQPNGHATPWNEGEAYDFAMEGLNLECYWFNVPMAGEGTEVPGTETPLDATETPGDGNSVTVYKWECPAGTEYGMAIDDYSAACDTEHLNIPINLTDANGDHATTTQANGTEWDDVVPVDGNPDDAVFLAEEIPDGFGEPVVYCQALDQDEWRLYEVEGGAFTLDDFGADTPWTVQCNWYNLPSDGNTVTVYKWDCPSGTMYDQEMDYYGAECATEHLNIPITLVDGNGAHETTTQANGTQWNDVVIGQEGELQIIEEIPSGYGDPVVYCWSNDGDPVLYESANGFVIPQPNAEGERFDFYCNWYNVPGEGSTITIYKYACPEDTGYDEEASYYEENCTQTLEDVDFRLTHSEGEETATTDANGEIVWGDVPLGSFSIQEYIPSEYGDPVVVCGFTAFDDGAVVDGFPQRVDAPGGYFESSLEFQNTDYFCWWYNIPGEPSEITIYKYTCPEGYDLYVWNANPQEDCTDATNGITFNMEGDGYESQSDTGDSVDGAVYFGGLEPGSYTAVESVPDGTSYVFVLDCYGQKMGELRPYPLWYGNDLRIDVSSGESIECYWYNVPDYDEGRLTVYKYECSTKTYTSDVDCEIYETGKEFDLVVWDGDSWEYVDTKTTDGGGMATWGGIDPGEYWLDEQDGDWCHIASEQMSDDGNWLNVSDGQETIVNVYNCSTDPKDPGKPGKTPTKYPNTGIPPVVQPDDRLQP